jgi:hypothetical protein
VNDINLLYHHLDGFRPGEFGRHVNRPKLSTDSTRAQARNVGGPRWLQLSRIRPEIHFAHVRVILVVLPRDIVVAVNQRRLLENLPDFSDLRSAGVGCRGRFLQSDGGHGGNKKCRQQMDLHSFAPKVWQCGRTPPSERITPFRFLSRRLGNLKV